MGRDLVRTGGSEYLQGLKQGSGHTTATIPTTHHAHTPTHHTPHTLTPIHAPLNRAGREQQELRV